MNITAEEKERRLEAVRKWRRENAERVKELNRKYYLANRDKHQKAHRQWYYENVDKAKENHKRWKAANPEKWAASKKNWKPKDPEKVRKSANERSKKNHKRYMTNSPTYRLNRNIGTLIRQQLRLKNIKKNNPTRVILSGVGYTLEELKTHLESLFLPGMTWDNRSEWHIDHIRPMGSFSYTSTDDLEFKKCWGLNNLRPIWAKDNLSKAAQDKIAIRLYKTYKNNEINNPNNPN